MRTVIVSQCRQKKTVAVSMMRFGMLSGLSFVANISITVLLHEGAGFPEELAFAIALVVVFVMNFLGCRLFVFNAQEGDPKRQFAMFLSSSVIFRLGEYLAFLLIHTLLGLYYIATIIAIKLFFTVIKFFFYRSAVFVPCDSVSQTTGPDTSVLRNDEPV